MADRVSSLADKERLLAEATTARQTMVELRQEHAAAVLRATRAAEDLESLNGAYQADEAKWARVINDLRRQNDLQAMPPGAGAGT